MTAFKVLFFFSVLVYSRLCVYGLILFLRPDGLNGTVIMWIFFPFEEKSYK